MTTFLSIQSSNFNSRAKTVCQGHKIQIYRSDKITKFQEMRSVVACQKNCNLFRRGLWQAKICIQQT